MGGARSLTTAMPVERVVAAVPERVGWRASEPCHRGMEWEWSGVRFEMLHPAVAATDNDGSCVLRVVGAGGALLLTGDIEAPAERELLNAGRPIGARVLVVPHHGSRSSSTEAFLDAVRPEVALFAVGYRNRYRFPHPLVVARYEARWVRRLNTANAGAVTIRLAADGKMEGACWREQSRRYWQPEESLGSCGALW
jgi:competence protein ComEC